MSDVTSVSIGPVLVGQTPPGFTVEQAKPQVTLNQPFGDAPNLTLLGYDLVEPVDLPDPVKITLYWRTEAPLATDYTTYLHVRNAAGETIVQQDQPPLQGAYPTSLWHPGEIIADEIVFSWPARLPEDGYELVVGLYDLKTGQRLSVAGNPANEVVLVKGE